jgi:hypothetical protein
VIVIEGCEESGSPDLMYYIEKLKGDIGTPNLVICLDRFLLFEFAHVIVALAIILACGSRLPCVGSVSS